MIVVCDTSPLNYLVLTGTDHVLTRLFQEVYVPPEVLRELLHERAPELVRSWAKAPPEWLIVASPSALIITSSGLGPGEIQAIALAKELRATRVVMDDRDGTRFARQQGLQVLGTLAVLELGAARGLLELSGALNRLQQTNFRVSPEYIQAALDREAARRSKGRIGDHETHGDEF